MYNTAMEDYWRDACYDAQHRNYKVTVTVAIEVEVTATDNDAAEDIAYDQIKNAMRGSKLDYSFENFETDAA